MSLTPDMMPAWELREHLKDRDAEIERLKAEVERKDAAYALLADAARDALDIIEGPRRSHPATGRGVMGERCETCRFSSYPFSNHSYPDQAVSSEPLLRCHRRAPVVAGGHMTPAWTAWPLVRLTEWCGEYEESKPND